MLCSVQIYHHFPRALRTLTIFQNIIMRRHVLAEDPGIFEDRLALTASKRDWSNSSLILNVRKGLAL
jgi:hypothetical protein